MIERLIHHQFVSKVGGLPGFDSSLTSTGHDFVKFVGGIIAFISLSCFSNCILRAPVCCSVKGQSLWSFDAKGIEMHSVESRFIRVSLLRFHSRKIILVLCSLHWMVVLSKEC